ncbi:hypothetical protein BG004_007477 [Podila humilis]|nr:hypothetical protein BG004_007477 [Podila humilis]
MPQVLQAKAIFDCNGDEDSELSFLEGDILVNVKETAEEGWLHGKLERTGEEGLFPDNYVEIIEMKAPSPRQPKSQPKPQPQPVAPPQLPARTPSIVATPLSAPAQNSVALANKPVFSPKPGLPARHTQASCTPAPTASELPQFGNRGGVALPGLGPIATKPNSAVGTVGSETTRTVSGPPMLPKRTNTFTDANDSTSQSGTPTSTKDRMAGLSMGASSGTPPAQLPSQSGSKDIAQKINNISAVRSPLSAAARPALPPRTLTDSHTDTTPNIAGSNSIKHTFHTQNAEAPTPKLTTFSRPRSARTSKSSSPVDTVPSVGTFENTVSTPPKLPTRNASSSTTPATQSRSQKPIDAGPVRFSPGLPRNGLTHESITTAVSALPAITRNSQPMPLPSRNLLNNSSPTTAASSKVSKPMGPQGMDGLVSQESTSPFGVRLNSVGSKPGIAAGHQLSSISGSHSTPSVTSGGPLGNVTPPPLPARSNTFTLTSSATAVTNTAAPTAAAAAATTTITTNVPSPVNFRTGMGAPQRAYNVDKSLDAMVGSWDNAGSKPGLQSVHGLPKMELVSSEHFGMPHESRRRYEALFRSVCSSGSIEGPKVYEIYVRSRLDSKTLAQIWDLVDIDNAGKLSKAQFCMGLYLIDERLASGTIPLEVSDELWVSAMH